MENSNRERPLKHDGSAPESELEIPSARASLLTTALVLGGIALFEPELVAGMVIGAGVTLLAGQLPSVPAIVRPVVKAAVKAAYSAAEIAAEAAEEIQDLMAEARAEHEEAAQKAEPRATH